MIYKYVFYKFYEWIRNWFDPFAPQVTTTLVMSLMPLSLLYLALRIAALLNLIAFDMRSAISPLVIAFAVIFLLLIIFNQIYFFSYYKWKEIILYFRANEISKSTKIAAYVYIAFTASIYFILFLFLGIEF